MADKKNSGDVSNLNAGCGICLTRREVLKQSIKIPLSIAAMSTIATLVSSCGGGGGGGSASPGVAGTYDYLFTDHPELNDNSLPGGTHTGTKVLSPGGVRVVVARFDDNVYTISGSCTHQGFDVTPYQGNEASGYFQCSQSGGVHMSGSQFSKTGVVLRGPAGVAIGTYTSTIVKDVSNNPTGIRITIS